MAAKEAFSLANLDAWILALGKEHGISIMMAASIFLLDTDTAFGKQGLAANRETPGDMGICKLASRILHVRAR